MRRAVLLLAVGLLATGCSPSDQGENADPDQVDAVEAPELGACRALTPRDVAQTSNATETVECSEPHTAQTYAVGQLPTKFDDSDYDAAELATYAYQTCSEKFIKFVGADESLAMRTVLSWAWFRPSKEAWESGARWYRCDVVGGGAQSKEYVELPEKTEGILFGKPDDKWLVCATGPSVDGSVKVPCSEPHDWRAISTIKLGGPKDKYPGDRLVEVRSRDFCSDQVGAWMQYPVDFDFGYTWFHEAEWEAGNRRSVCWAKTDEMIVVRTIALVVASLLLASCSSGDEPRPEPSASPSATTSTTPSPAAVKPPPAPKVGECYDLTFEQALAPTSKKEPSSCKRATAQDGVRRDRGRTRRRAPARRGLQAGAGRDRADLPGAGGAVRRCEPAGSAPEHGAAGVVLPHAGRVRRGRDVVPLRRDLAVVGEEARPPATDEGRAGRRRRPVRRVRHLRARHARVRAGCLRAAARVAGDRLLRRGRQAISRRGGAARCGRGPVQVGRGVAGRGLPGLRVGAGLADEGAVGRGAALGLCWAWTRSAAEARPVSGAAPSGGGAEVCPPDARWQARSDASGAGRRSHGGTTRAVAERGFGGAEARWTTAHTGEPPLAEAAHGAYVEA